MNYKNAGVDIEAGYRSVELMKEHIRQTMRPEVLTGIGGFSGAFSMEAFKSFSRADEGAYQTDDAPGGADRYRRIFRSIFHGGF